MLQRPPRPDRTAASARQARYRRRQREGTMPVTIEVNAAILDLLIETEWLAEPDVADRRKIANAIERMLADPRNQK
jgi:hypothetical protein